MNLHIRKQIKANNHSQPLYERTLRPQNRDNRFTKKQLFTAVTKRAYDKTLNSTSENVEDNIELFKSTVKIKVKLSETHLTQNNYGNKIISVMTSLIYARMQCILSLTLLFYMKKNK